VKHYGIGLIGIGMGSTLLELNRYGGNSLEVRGICSGHIENARRLGKNYSLKYVVADYRELLDKDDIDIIAVYSPDHLHAEQCVAALSAGKHVICTKPLATSVEDAQEIADLAEKNNLKFLLGQTMRYEPQFSTIRTMLDDGDLGRIFMAEAHYVHDMRPVFQATPWRLNAPKDYLYGAVCHPLDILRWFVGEVIEVFAYACKGGLTPEYPLQSNFLLNLRFANGIIGRVLGGFDVVHPPFPMMKVGLFGTGASVTGEYADLKGGDVRVVFDKFDAEDGACFSFPAETNGAYGHSKTVFRYLDHFEKCLHTDSRPVPDAREGLATVKVCAAAWESIRAGKPVGIQ
jgi:predicted dehydrogenase